MPYKPIPILMYHQIDTSKRGAPFRSLSVHPKSFARQMWLLNLLGYKGVSMSDLTPYLRGDKQGKVVGITFDDGYLNNLENALPILTKYGFSSTVYIVSQKQTNDWDLPHNIEQKPLMNNTQQKQWLSAGQEIGAHTRHHLNLMKIAPEEAKQEIERCKSELEQGLNTQVNHFCYPYGQYTKKIVDMVKAAGYITATTVQRSRVYAEDDLFELPRVSVGRHNHLLAFLMKLIATYEDKR